MDTEIYKISKKDINQDIIAWCAAKIDSGGLVAFPTETVYGIGCRARKDSIEKLNHLKNRTPDKHYTLHIGEKDQISNFVPYPGLKAKKLFQNLLPGPLTVVFELSKDQMQAIEKKFPPEIIDILYKNNTLGVRCPDHAIPSKLLKTCREPVVAPSANITGKKPSIDAQQVRKQFEGQLDAIIDGGKCPFKKSSTVVKAGAKKVRILREGVIPKEDIDFFSEIKILFVCTGNSCRSPMAEGIFKKLLSEKLDCGVDELQKLGYKIMSAGTMGISGLPVSTEAVNACAAKGIDISQHKSNALTRKRIEEADIVFVMTQDHKKNVLKICPGSEKKCVLLSSEGNIVDPIGRGQKAYNECSDIIESSLNKRLKELKL